MAPHDPYADFAALVARLVDEPPGSTRDLDRAAALIGTHLDYGLTADDVVEWLDAFAETFDGSTGADVIAWMAADGFRGNIDDYYDPRNSYLHEVLDRRLGIPITLSIVAIEVGRRHGIALDGVGLPGEFLVVERDDPDRFHNPFRGRSMGPDDVTALVRKFVGPNGRLTPAMRRPVGTLDIAARMLTNLIHIFERTVRPTELAWALRLRTVLPDPDEAESALQRLHARFN